MNKLAKYIRLEEIEDKPEYRLLFRIEGRQDLLDIRLPAEDTNQLLEDLEEELYE